MGGGSSKSSRVGVPIESFEVRYLRQLRHHVGILDVVVDDVLLLIIEYLRSEHIILLGGTLGPNSTSWSYPDVSIAPVSLMYNILDPQWISLSNLPSPVPYSYEQDTAWIHQNTMYIFTRSHVDGPCIHHIPLSSLINNNHHFQVQSPVGSPPPALHRSASPLSPLSRFRGSSKGGDTTHALTPADARSQSSSSHHHEVISSSPKLTTSPVAAMVEWSRMSSPLPEQLASSRWMDQYNSTAVCDSQLHWFGINNQRQVWHYMWCAMSKLWKVLAPPSCNPHHVVAVNQPESIHSIDDGQGGTTITTTATSYLIALSSTTMEQYSIATGTWTILPDRLARNWYHVRHVVVPNDSIYFLGGSAGSNLSDPATQITRMERWRYIFALPSIYCLLDIFETWGIMLIKQSDGTQMV
jgi:hypothetical protein